MHDAPEYFLHAAIDCLRETKRVLRVQGVAPEHRMVVDFGPYISAMGDVCMAASRDAHGVALLEDIHRLIELLLSQNLKPTESIEKCELANDYREWLRASFPEAARHRSLRAERCERCGLRTATVHYVVASGSGIEWHEFCNPCHDEWEAQNLDPGQH